MRVLMTSTPGTGHLHPLAPLAHELVRAGHELLWATAASSCPKVESFGFRAVPCGMELGVRRGLFAERAPHFATLPPRHRRAIAFSVLFGELAAPVMHDGLVDIFDSFRPQLVLHDFAELAAAPIATARGVPHVSIGFSGALTDEAQAAAEELVAPVWKREGLQVTSSAFNGDLLLHPYPAVLDAPRPDGPAAPMRPVLFDGATPALPPDWLSSFGAERPGVYVTFGTEVASLAPWSAIFAALATFDVDVVATLGGQVDPGSLGAIPANIRVEQYVPQGLLLERTQLVVSHAGAGTLMAAACAGKAQLCIPIAADQWDNADVVTRAHAGLTLEPGDRQEDAIGRTVDVLIRDASIQASAERLSDLFAAMPHPRDLVPELEALA